MKDTSLYTLKKRQVEGTAEKQKKSPHPKQSPNLDPGLEGLLEDMFLLLKADSHGTWS